MEGIYGKAGKEGKVRVRQVSLLLRSWRDVGGRMGNIGKRGHD